MGFTAKTKTQGSTKPTRCNITSTHSNTKPTQFKTKLMQNKEMLNQGRSEMSTLISRPLVSIIFLLKSI